MQSKKYTIGIDFGTLSGRALLADAGSGEEILSVVYDYPHGVMDTALPCGKKLGQDWALQHPQDYLDVLAHTIPALLEQSGVAPGDIIGIGTDFTACTMIPVKSDGTPLCTLPEYAGNPHAWVKLWKHHAAQDHANRLNEIAARRNESWLKNYGGKISSEWAVPKLWQVLEEAPEIYDAMDRWIEAADWIVWQLTGRETRNSCTAGYKELWNKRKGYPSTEFFKALDPRLEHVVQEKLGAEREILPLGAKAGTVSKKAAEFLGIPSLEGIPVAVGNVDAHVCVPAVGIDGPGKMLAIIGTSTCHMMMSQEEIQVPGICGVVEDGIMPGYFGYEAGQSCVGDHFAWLIDHCVPEAYAAEARAEKISLHQLLRRKAERQKPGAHGLIALDWWNGNRSVLVDADLTGMILGMTLQTRPEDIYRALIEATAYGTRVLIENYRKHGVPVREFFASGGIAFKDAMTMQIYADVLNMPVKIAGTAQGPALGAAIFGAVAAGKEAGGYEDVFTAARRMGKVKTEFYSPIPENVSVYNQLFAEYQQLHDYFGRGANQVMKRLKALKVKQSGTFEN